LRFRAAKGGWRGVELESRDTVSPFAPIPLFVVGSLLLNPFTPETALLGLSPDVLATTSLALLPGCDITALA
jgi:hypothetical protein